MNSELVICGRLLGTTTGWDPVDQGVDTYYGVRLSTRPAELFYITADFNTGVIALRDACVLEPEPEHFDLLEFLAAFPKVSSLG